MKSPEDVRKLRIERMQPINGFLDEPLTVSEGRAMFRKKPEEFFDLAGVALEDADDETVMQALVEKGLSWD